MLKCRLKALNDPKAFIEYSNDMDEIYENIEQFNTERKRKVLIVFDDIIADIISNLKLNPIVAELLIKGRKLNIYVVLIMQSYFKVPKNVRLNSLLFFLMKIPNKWKLQQTPFDHSLDTDFGEFKNIYKIFKCTVKQYSSLVNDTTLSSDNYLRFRKNLSEGL